MHLTTIKPFTTDVNILPLTSRIPHIFPYVKEVFLNEIISCLDTDFFKPIRQDYIDFDKWFKTKSEEGRKAWIYELGYNQINAICIYKEEHSPKVTAHEHLFGKTLKLCTFKIDEKMGKKGVGELLLKKALAYATENKMENIYVTVRSNRNEVISFFEKFGFKNQGIYHNDPGDLVLVKSIFQKKI